MLPFHSRWKYAATSPRTQRRPLCHGFPKQAIKTTNAVPPPNAIDRFERFIKPGERGIEHEFG